MKTLKASIGIVLFVVVLSLFAAGNADADILVYDADGQYLGILAEGEGNVTVYMPSIELFFIISTDGGINRWSFLYYESDNCTGQPYLYYRTAPELYYWNDGKYWQGEKVTPNRIYISSSLDVYGECKKYNYVKLSGPMVPAIEAPPPPFTLPVALPLSFEVEKKHGGRR
ncbi:MAG TPA: hypothetical protein ENG75_01130 [Nitrospirae bacterium]|nr:hypothetical protein [Nitrospirota bacterium]HDK16531.1 hypothetical protein [Nitrospirota bacterium]